jgi:lauroyl/myristoyl acyltransferase
MLFADLKRHLHRPLGYLPKIINLPTAFRVIDALVTADDARADRRKMRESLRLIFPDKSGAWVDKTLRQITIHYNWAYIDSLVLPVMSEAEIDQVFEVEGLELVDRAMHKGRGVMLYGIHYGRFWGGPIYPCKKGYTLSYIARTRGLAAAHHTNRAITGRMINVDEFDKQEVYEVLQRNELLMTMADGNAGRKPVTVDFLGQAAQFSPSFIVFAREAGAPLIGWITFSISRERIGLRFMPVDLPEALPLDQQMEALLAPLIEIVKQDPTQWYSARRIARRAAETI